MPKNVGVRVLRYMDPPEFGFGILLNHASNEFPLEREMLWHGEQMSGY